MVILFIWKRALLFSFFIISFFCNGQKIIRFSDGKQIDSVFVVNSSQKILIHKKNVVNYNYTANDRILYQNKIYDFAMEKDSLILFDKTKEIEPVNIVNVNNKKEIFVKNRKKARFVYSIISNVKDAVFIPNTLDKKSYVKSISIFPKKVLIKGGVLEIFFYGNENGVPKDDVLLLKIEKNVNDVETGTFEIVLPKAIKYPENGFFVVFYIRDKGSVLGRKTIDLNCSEEAIGLIKQDQAINNKWSPIDFPSLQYKLKILQ